MPVRCLHNWTWRSALLCCTAAALLFAPVAQSLTNNKYSKPSSAAKQSTESRPEVNAAAIKAMRKLNLITPTKDTSIEKWKGSFYEMRGGSPHHAVDIIAARNTEVRAVADGVIARLFESKAGGQTIYQFDPERHYVFYYAHLERYRQGLADGDRVKKGDLIAYVGTSGNAPKNCPHLHFEIGVLTEKGEWWKSTAIDPYEVYRGLKTNEGSK